MPAGFPVTIGYCAGTDYGGSLANIGTAVAGGSGSPGAWVALGTALYDIDFLDIELMGYGASAVRSLVDIGVGAPGSEQAVISQLYTACTSGSVRTPPFFYQLPFSIPAGAKISARATNNTGTQSVYVKMNGYSGGFAAYPGFTVADALNASTSGGAVLTTGAAATKGAFASLIAQTAKDYDGLLVCLNYLSVADAFLVDIAAGGAGDEQILVPNLVHANSTGALYYRGKIAFYRRSIPAGARISARASAAANASATINCNLWGLY